MLKAGIITMHRSDNYGAVLQAYALVEVLKKIGVDSEIINYIPKRFRTFIQFLYVHPRRYNGNILKKYMIMLGSIPVRALIKYRYRTFLKKYLPVGEKKYFTEKQLEENTPYYDVYISGSDQVWNPDFEGRLDPAFFLAFAPKNAKKIAYASSFGKKSLNDSEKIIASDLLQKYDAISVREQSGKDIINELGLKAEFLLDPTFLLTGKEWKRFSNKRIVRDKYVLIYQLNPNPRLLEIATYIAKKHGLKVVKFSRDIIKQKGIDINLAFQKPEYFVSMISNAEYIVTDSFHGTAFSINLHKKFTVVMPPKYSDRLTSILTKLCLTDRSNAEKFDDEINYEKIENILIEERKKSIEFLLKNIGGGGNEGVFIYK